MYLHSLLTFNVELFLKWFNLHLQPKIHTPWIPKQKQILHKWIFRFSIQKIKQNKIIYSNNNFNSNFNSSNNSNFNSSNNINFNSNNNMYNYNNNNHSKNNNEDSSIAFFFSHISLLTFSNSQSQPIERLVPLKRLLCLVNLVFSKPCILKRGSS